MRHSTSHRKQSVYWPPEMIDELEAEAKRIGKPLSWVAQKCVRLSMSAIRAYPSPDEISLVPSPKKEERR